MARRRRGTITLVVMGLSLLSFLFFQLVIRPPVVRFTVRVDSETGGTIEPVWTRLNIWDVTMAPSAPPSPFIREVILMTATGGRQTSEILHQNPNGTVDLDFSSLDSALDKVITAGLHPTIVLGNTPEDLSDSPGELGAFNANVGAPRDYDVYFDYVKSLFSHLVDRYGGELVESWNFRLMTEPDNADWWKAGRTEYQKLYDYTLAAARISAPGVVIDVGNLMTPTGKDAWTEQWSHWISTGSNPILPGSVPRTIRRLGFSCYARGQIGMDPRELGEVAEEIREKAPGFEDALLSVDEGMILIDEEGKRLWLGDGSELGAAWNAAIVKVSLDHGIERYVQWGFEIDGVKSPSYNVFSMWEKMLGDSILVTVQGGTKPPSSSYLDAIASRNDVGDVRIFVFHYRPDRDPIGSHKVKIDVKGLDGSYTMNHWRVDYNHSNFFNKWIEDSEDLPRMDAGSGSGSIWDLAITNVLGKSGWEFWNSRKEGYKQIDDLEIFEAPEELEVSGTLTREVVLPPNSVSLFELIRN
jgi:hypothetical protein